MTFKEDLEAVVLSCLLPGPAHGYELSKRIRAMSEDVLSVAEGKLYPALHRLEEYGDVSAVWMPQGNKPPRKVYELTETGHKTLGRKQAEWKKFASGISSLMAHTPSTWKVTA
jgi:PadR family transcriptional regulator PadR